MQCNARKFHEVKLCIACTPSPSLSSRAVLGGLVLQRSPWAEDARSGRKRTKRRHSCARGAPICAPFTGVALSVPPSSLRCGARLFHFACGFRRRAFVAPSQHSRHHSTRTPRQFHVSLASRRFPRPKNPKKQATKMADKIVEQPEVVTEEVEKDLKEKKTEEVTAVEEKTDAEEEDEEAKENGAEKEPNGKEATNGDSTPAADESDKCIKRKSTGGETEEAKTEEVIPEKKAKLDEEAAPADENGAEVAA